ncbi:MAG: hypothetical protein HUJ53_01440 [Holdemanella sp.]|nr:hypothetical protein [Holdemanella sp.]
MTMYTIKVIATAKDDNPNFKGEVHEYYYCKGGYVLDNLPAWQEDCYKNRWQAQKEADKVQDEKYWYKKGEVVEVEF